MKKCPYCAEKIQSDAIKCKFCGEFFKDELLKNKSSDIVEEEKISFWTDPVKKGFWGKQIDNWRNKGTYGKTGLLIAIVGLSFWGTKGCHTKVNRDIRLPLYSTDWVSVIITMIIIF